MNDKKMTPWADLKVKIREYQDKETGKTKGVYQTIGTMFSSPHGSHLAIKIDSIPVTEWNGWVSVYQRDDARTLTQNEVLEKSGEFSPKELNDNNVDLGEIPF